MKRNESPPDSCKDSMPIEVPKNKNLLPSEFSNRHDTYIAIALAFVVLVVGIWQMIVGVCGTFHDDAIYVSTAKAIAQGQGYRLINLPNAPVQTKYPFLYPAILAVIWRLFPSFPDNLLAMQGLSLLAGSMTIAFAYLYLVRFGYCSRSCALASCLFCTFAPYFIYFSTQTLSEIPFAVLFILSGWILERHLKEPFEKRSSQLLLGIFLATPFLCRTIGGIVVPVALIILLFNRRPIIWVTVGSLAGTLPWILWVLIHVGGTSQDASAIYYTDYLAWWSSHGLASITRVICLNLLMILASGVEVGLAGFSKALSVLSLGPKLTIKLLPGLLILIVMYSDLRRARVLPCMMAGYLLVVCMWPWPPYRFTLPIMPFFLAYMLRGMSRILRSFSSLPAYRGIVLLVVGGLMVSNLALLNRYSQIKHLTHFPSNGIAGSQVSWSSYKKVFTWIAEHTEPDDVIASGFDTMIYLYTGRKAIRPFVVRPTAMFYGEEEEILGSLKNLEQFFSIYNPRYLVHTPMPLFSEERPFAELIERAISKTPALLTPVYVGEDNRFVIFQIRLASGIDTY